MGALHGLLCLQRRTRVGGTDIQWENDIGSKLSLSTHDALRRQQMGRAIQVRFECSTFLAQSAQVTEAKDLEAATIGQDGTIPMHKGMQTTKLGKEFRAGTQHEVIGIGKENLDASRVQFFR